VSFQLESMDERVVPSSISLAQLRHSMAAAAARAASFRSTGFARPNAFGPTIAVHSSARVSSTRTAAPHQAAAVSRPVTLTTPVSQTTVTRQAATSDDVGDVKNGPLAKAGQDLIHLYQDPSHPPAGIQVVGNSVRVDIRGPGNVNSLAGALADLGMKVEHIDGNTRTVEGLLPISQLVNAAQLSQVTTISPVYMPRH